MTVNLRTEDSVESLDVGSALRHCVVAMHRRGFLSRGLVNAIKTAERSLLVLLHTAFHMIARAPTDPTPNCLNPTFGYSILRPNYCHPYPTFRVFLFFFLGTPYVPFFYFKARPYVEAFDPTLTNNLYFHAL